MIYFPTVLLKQYLIDFVSRYAMNGTLDPLANSIAAAGLMLTGC